MPPNRAVIDTSVLLRFPLPSRNQARAVDLSVEAALVGAFDVLLPPELLAEVVDKLATKRYLAERIDPRRVRILTLLLERTAILLAPYDGPFPSLTRDAKDDYLLAYALRDRADYLVSGDRDLLDLAPEIALPKIVDPGVFLGALRDRGLVDR